MSKKISLFSLVLLIITGIDNIKNLPASALFGSELIFFFLLSAALFLIPTSLVSAELSATFADKGGVYHWVDKAFGEKWAMVAIWKQWINTMVWYPTILSFIAATAAYLIQPDLASSTHFLLPVILCVFWVITLINLRGIHTSAKINTACGLLGTVIPLSILIILGGIWIFEKKPIHISFSLKNMLPSLGEKESWISLIAIMASFLGMELSGVHVNDIRNPQKNFPRATLYSCSFILLSMLLGSLTIAMIIPENTISLLSGVMQVFSILLNDYGLGALLPVMTLLIVIGSIGNITNWLISPAKGLLHAAEYGFLPPFFSHKNKHGVASRILIAQGLVVSAFCLIYFLIPSVNGFFWFLTALSTELYMIMYVLMFLAALKLHHNHKDRPQVFKIPGKHIGMWTTCVLGLIGCIATIAVSFFPPENVDVGSKTRYLMLIIMGNIVTITPVLLFFYYKKKKSQSAA